MVKVEPITAGTSLFETNILFGSSEVPSRVFVGKIHILCKQFTDFVNRIPLKDSKASESSIISKIVILKRKTCVHRMC